jgi:hypothetical protein
MSVLEANPPSRVERGVSPPARAQRRRLAGARAAQGRDASGRARSQGRELGSGARARGGGRPSEGTCRPSPLSRLSIPIRVALRAHTHCSHLVDGPRDWTDRDDLFELWVLWVCVLGRCVLGEEENPFFRCGVRASSSAATGVSFFGGVTSIKKRRLLVGARSRRGRKRHAHTRTHTQRRRPWVSLGGGFQKQVVRRKSRARRRGVFFALAGRALSLFLSMCGQGG